jgi:hypothetical protein
MGESSIIDYNFIGIQRWFRSDIAGGVIAADGSPLELKSVTAGTRDIRRRSC